MDNEPIRVLLIDDDLGDSQMIRAMLAKAQHEKFRVDWVSNFEEAMDAFEAGDHHVFLLDYFLEDRTGLDLLKEVQERGLDVPIIMLTGRGSRSVDEEATELGALDYLVKGEIDPVVLEGAIRKVLGREGGEAAVERASDPKAGEPSLFEVSGQARMAFAPPVSTTPPPAASETRFRAVFEATRSGVALVGLDGQVMEINPALAGFLGGTGRWAEGMSYLELLEESDKEAVAKELSALATGERARFEAARRFLTKEGLVKWAHTTMALVQTEEGDRDHIVVVLDEASSEDS